MRILVLSYEFPPIGGGGGRVAEEVCRVLARRGHEIVVETAYLDGLPEIEERDGYLIHRNYSMRKEAHVCTPFQMGAYAALNAAPVLKRARQWKPEIVHAHFAVPTGILAYLCRTVLGVPYVLNAYLGDVPGAVPEQTDSIFRWIKPFTVPIWSKASKVLTGTAFVKNLALRSYHAPIEVIPYGIDLSRCKSSDPSPARPRRLLFAGRLTAQKNPMFLVRILERLKNLDWTLEMLGDGPLMDQVKAAISETGLQGRINVRGWVSLEDLRTEMSRSDALVMPSLSESFPVVGMMALGHGLAILGSRIGGLEDLVSESANGFLVPLNDEDAFKDNLEALITSDSLAEKMKTESRRLSSRFDIETICDRYETIFQAAVEDMSRGGPF